MTRKFTRRGGQAQDETTNGGEGDAMLGSAPLDTNRAQAAQRLQIGLFGIGAMVLLIGLANILGNQADMAKENAVPEAAPTTEPSAAPSQRDPLADAGIVPEIPAEPASGEAQVEDLPAPAATSNASPAAGNGPAQE